MSTLVSTAEPASPAFAANDAAQRALVDELRTRLRTAAAGGPQAARERHVARGKLLPRERVELLLDDGSPFLEIAPLAALDVYEDDTPGAGLITGIGLVAGRHVMVICNEATVKGGTFYPISV
ncbi:MAG: carboxyl transferase domain-containing protein, partial [Brevundimonas sp.]